MTQFEGIKAYIKILRERRGLTQKDMADKLDIGLRQYQRIESTGRSSIDTLDKIAALLETTFADMLAASKSQNSSIEERKHGLNKIGMSIVDAFEFKSVPLLNRIPASGFLLGYESDVEEWVSTSTNVPHSFALRVTGDSMLPEIKDGDIVIVAPETHFENNQIYAVVAGDDEHTLKTVRKVEDGYWLLPMNQDYEAIYVKDEKMIKLYRVLELHRRRFKK